MEKLDHVPTRAVSSQSHLAPPGMVRCPYHIDDDPDEDDKPSNVGPYDYEDDDDDDYEEVPPVEPLPPTPPSYGPPTPDHDSLRLVVMQALAKLAMTLGPLDQLTPSMSTLSPEPFSPMRPGHVLCAC